MKSIVCMATKRAINLKETEAIHQFCIWITTNTDNA